MSNMLMAKTQPPMPAYYGYRAGINGNNVYQCISLWVDIT